MENMFRTKKRARLSRLAFMVFLKETHTQEKSELYYDLMSMMKRDGNMQKLT